MDDRNESSESHAKMLTYGELFTAKVSQAYAPMLGELRKQNPSSAMMMVKTAKEYPRNT